MKKEMKFKDLTQDTVQIIRKPKLERSKYMEVFYVLRFGKTLLHNHPYVIVMKLDDWYKSSCDTEKIMAADFDRMEFEEVYIGTKPTGEN